MKKLLVSALFMGVLYSCSNEDQDREYLNNGPQFERVTDHSNDLPKEDEILQRN